MEPKKGTASVCLDRHVLYCTVYNEHNFTMAQLAIHTTGRLYVVCLDKYYNGYASMHARQRQLGGQN